MEVLHTVTGRLVDWFQGKHHFSSQLQVSFTFLVFQATSYYLAERPLPPWHVTLHGHFPIRQLIFYSSVSHVRETLLSSFISYQEKSRFVLQVLMLLDRLLLTHPSVCTATIHSP
jgi:hypothetical protein